MLKEHSHYVYHSENRVYARRGSEAPVLATTCESAQDAYELVQSIVNPEKVHPATFGHLGYNHPDFQAAIGPNCKEFVEQAYSAAPAGA